MRKNAPKYTFLTILDILTSAQFGGIYIMYIIFATSRAVAKIPTLCPTLQLLPHIAPTNTLTSPLPASLHVQCSFNKPVGRNATMQLMHDLWKHFFIFLQTFYYFFSIGQYIPNVFITFFVN